MYGPPGDMDFRVVYTWPWMNEGTDPSLWTNQDASCVDRNPNGKATGSFSALTLAVGRF